MNSHDSKPARITSIDAYRGLVMFLMMAEVLHLDEVARHVPRQPRLAVPRVPHQTTSSGAAARCTT